ncbi:MAG TPA: GNAT family N-acetyltransferase [Opitutaceae bacterium]
MKLWPLEHDGTVGNLPYPLPEVVKPVLATFAKMYETTPYQPPWIGYLASEGEVLIGTCAFKSAPKDSIVEIAYFSFPGHEGRGVATRMAQKLVEISHATDPSVTVIAQTLPAHGASTRVLQKLGFIWRRSLQHPEDGLVWEWHHEKDKTAQP